MKSLRLAFAAGISLIALTTLRADDGSFGKTWMSQYSQNARPDDFVQAVYSLDRAGYFDGAGQPGTAFGFFSVVFKESPSEVDGWLKDSFAFLPERHRRILAAAAWLAGNPAGTKRLRELSYDASGNMREELAYRVFAINPVAVRRIPVVSETSMNLQWGAYLASGDEQHILNIFAALGSNEPGLATSARFALAEKASAYPRVMQICREELDRQPQAIRTEIQAAVNEATLRKPGA
jgi:hypothetical protein